jgi:hypothetical protein
MGKKNIFLPLSKLETRILMNISNIKQVTLGATNYRISKKNTLQNNI